MFSFYVLQSTWSWVQLQPSLIMGNKASRRKSASDVPAKKRKKGSSTTTPTDANGKHDKHISCPNLGGAVPYRQYDEEPKIKYNIYRSYRDRDNNKVKNDSTVDIRIYRRSTAELPSSRPQTLPRGFGRSKRRLRTWWT